MKIIKIWVRDCKYFCSYEDRSKYSGEDGDCNHVRGAVRCNPEKCPIDIQSSASTVRDENG